MRVEVGWYGMEVSFCTYDVLTFWARYWCVPDLGESKCGCWGHCVYVHGHCIVLVLVHFEFVGCVVRQGKGCTGPSCSIAGDCPEVRVSGFVGDVCFGPEEESDRIESYYALGIDAYV